uniref:Iron-containing redox enzyme family protein n=1 Tax=Desertifilum tharense IPPAS B-1220 TaxID=1781255 RepID=A0ACD5H0W3_9CYAN
MKNTVQTRLVPQAFLLLYKNARRVGNGYRTGSLFRSRSLASSGTIINHSFLMTERKRYFLRYIGGLLYGELTVPAAFRYYKAAGERLGLSEEGMSYWTLHIKVDELHGRWMIEDVALPLIDLYPEDAWEIVLGYDQQRLMSDRAPEAITQSVREAEQVSH